MPSVPDHSGRVIAARYRLLSVVGTGGFGRVYRALDERLDTTVAVKVINPWWADEPEWVDRFIQEAKTAAKIKHPGIVRVTDTGTDSGLGPFTVAELVDGPSLRAVLDREGKMPVGKAVELVCQAADALAAAHDRGVVHRDVKPGNLLLDRDGRLRICDFGIARLQSGQTTTSASHTVVGTPHYMAPEQALGKATTPAADQYALGVVLYELLSGHVPFDGETPVAIGLAHVGEQPPALPGNIPSRVRVAVERALAKSPADRYRDMRAFAAALQPGKRAGSEQRAGEDRTRPLRQQRGDSTTAVTEHQTGRERRRTIVGAVALLAVGVGIAVAVVATRDGGGAQRAEGAPTRERSPIPAPSASTTPAATAIPTPTVRVPRLIGLQETTARLRASRRGLTVASSRRHSAGTKAGAIMRQRPAPGAKAEEGDLVRVTISSGPPPITVPELTGTPASAASQRLASLGLGAKTRERVSAREPGTVIRSEPSGGATVTRGSQVTLVVARPKQWHTVATYTLDSDGSTPSFSISGSSWRIAYTVQELSCEYDLIDCDPPSMQIDQTDGGYAYDNVDLSEGTHTTYGPDGPGRFRLSVRAVSGEWTVTARVEELS